MRSEARHVNPFILSTIFALLLALVTMLGAPAPLYAQEKTLEWERFDVDIVVNVDGTMDVSEHQTIRFTEGTFTFGYRDLPVNNFGHIDNWVITDASGNVYAPTGWGKDPYTFTVDDSGSRYVINWYFPPIADAAETYTLSYTRPQRPALLRWR